MSDRSFYEQLRGILERESVVIATIVKVLGSAPREVGAKMAICQDSSIIGTIGGGAGEGKVIKEALKIFETEEKQLVEIDLTGTPGKDIQGVCGGKVRVWLEKWSGESAIALVDEILQILETGQTAKLITPFAWDTEPYLISPTASSTLPVSLSPNLHVTSNQFSQTIQPSPILLIIGGGHVAVSLAKIASFAGFQIAIQDDRPEFVTPQRFPQAAFLSASIDEILNAFALHSQLYVALVTRGYPQDIEALKALLQYPIAYQYLGAIGSQKRITMILQALTKQGIPSERLQNFYAPIGLDIGALTPEEIAVSICGELIKVRRGGTGLSLCDRIQDSKRSRVHLSHLGV